jgi:PAS domain S-box-containing protein
MDGFWLVDTQGRLLEVNDAYCRMSGYTREELQRMSIVDLEANESPDEIATQIGQIIQNGGARFERQHRRKDGCVVDVELSVNYLPSSGGQLVCFLRDITERKRIDETLRKERALFRTIIDNIPYPIYAKDAHARKTVANLADIRIIGASSEAEVLNKDDFELFATERAKKFHAVDQSVLQTGKPIMDVEDAFTNESGETIWLLSSKIPFFDDNGKIAGLVGVAKDITERKVMEEQLRQSQKLESIGQLAGGVAHDFNNILSVMMIRLNSMQNHASLDPELQETVADLALDAKRAASLTRQLLLFSRRSVMAVELLDLNELVANLLNMLSRLIGEHITVRFDHHGGLPIVEADAGMIEQVIMNLAVNARDAMPKGGLLTIKTEPIQIDEERVKGNIAARPGQFVCLSVGDTGCGMTESTLKRIFEPFFTTKEIGHGTGLGLATVHGIVAQHKGWVEVESELGNGATFHVFLPATTKTKAEPAQAGKMTAFRGHETILLVEDELGLRRLVAKSLLLLGYRVLEADNGPTAMHLWQEHGPQIDLLLSDMVMPGGMSGLELAEVLRKEKRNLKIILSSGYNTEMPGQASQTTRGIVCLQKPYEFDVLSKTVRECLDRT